MYQIKHGIVEEENYCILGLLKEELSRWDHFQGWSEKQIHKDPALMLERNFMCLAEMEKNEKQAGFLEKEGGKCLMELYCCGTLF
ncbi:hypothetical protein GRJ2_000262700 [Grus japonensis]|uniref:Uncharacterized protein n=1 Tax=Grus japonensis TaxID=30415 RepID=A0ABC9VX55_GRUJA